MTHDHDARGHAEHRHGVDNRSQRVVHQRVVHVNAGVLQLFAGVSVGVEIETVGRHSRADERDGRHLRAAGDGGDEHSLQDRAHVGFTTMAVARKSTTIKNTTTVSTLLIYLMLPLRTSASAAAEMMMQYSAR